MHSENLIRFGLDNWSSFSRDREWTNIKMDVHLLLILSFFLIVFLICWRLKKISFWIRSLTKGFCVKGDWLNIGFNKSLWYDPWNFFSKLYFFCLIWFRTNSPPILICEFHHLFSFWYSMNNDFCWAKRKKKKNRERWSITRLLKN